MGSEARVGEAFSHVAEKIVRLLVQHLQLMRSEAEREVQSLTSRGKSFGTTLARAAPFLIAGAVLSSLAVAELAGLLLEPWLGRAAAPIMILVVGLTELFGAGHWLRSTLKERPAGIGGQEGPLRSGAIGTETPSPVPKVFAARTGVAEEKSYGPVG